MKLELTKCLVRHKGTYLLLRKTNDLFPTNNGKWECPGTLLHEGETPRIAAERAIKEETGLTVRLIKELPYLHQRSADMDSHCHIYLYETNSNEVTLGPDHDAYEWIAPLEIKNKELVRFAGLLLEYFNNPQLYLN